MDTPNTVKGGKKNKANGDAPKPVKNKAEGLKIVTTLSAHPSKFRLVEKFRGRVQPVSDAILVELADSMRTTCQQQPIQARAVPGSDEYETIFGNSRKLAGDMIAAGYTGADGKTYEPAPGFVLRAEIVECDDEEAIKRNLIENHQRTQTTAVDNAFNHQMLRDTYGMSDAAITKFYGYAHQATVTRLKKLLDLPEQYHTEINNGRLTASAAFVLADVGEEFGESKEANRNAVWLKVVDAVGKGGEDTETGEGAIGSTAMSNAVKAWRKEKKEAATPATPSDPNAPATPPVETPAEPETPAGPGRPATGKVSLTMKQYKDTLAQMAGHEKCPDRTAEVIKQFLAFASGDLDAALLADWLKTNIGGEVKETPATPETETPATPEA